MRRLDGNYSSSRGVHPLLAFAAAGEHERVRLALFDYAKLQVTVVRRAGYGVPVVQGLSYSV